MLPAAVRGVARRAAARVAPVSRAPMQRAAIGTLAGRTATRCSGVTADARPAAVRASGWGRLGGVRSLFIQTEDTPNPSSLKFLPGKEVLPEELGSSMDFRKGDPTDNSPLVRLLLRVQGVQGVFLGNDFITVSKDESLTWAQLKPEIFGTIMDFYAAGKPAVSGPMNAANNEGDVHAEDESEIVLLIKELLEDRIRPMVHEDGGDIFFKGFDEESGIVRVQLAGSCSGCPSSTVTLKSGVENMLMHYIPEVKGVQSVGEMDEDPQARALTFNKAD